MVASLTRWVLGHRLAVVLAWLVLTVGGVMAASSLGGALSQKFSIPGAAIRTNDRIEQEFGSGGSPLVPVVSVASGDLRQPALARRVAFASSRVLDALPGSRFASFATTGDPAFLLPDHRTEYALIFTPEGRTRQLSGGLLDAARRAARSVSVAGAPVEVTGMDSLRTAGSQSKGTGVMAEAMLGAGGALIVLAFVFASSSRSCRC